MSSSPNNAANAASASDRARLTEAEKKANHILSEQKRRQAIRQGFDRLASMVPGMEGQGRSEAVVLDATVKEIAKELQRQKALHSKAVPQGMMNENDFKAMYDQGQNQGQSQTQEQAYPQQQHSGANGGPGGKGKKVRVKEETK